MMPWWKNIISYVFPVKIDTCYSEYSGELELKLVNGQFQILTENAIYSYGKKYYNYAETFKKIKIEQYPIQKVLVLGYGLGSVPQILAQYFPKLAITGIEIDPEIIAWNKSYGYINAQTEIVQMDAIEWIKTSSEKFDLIILDLFIDDQVPEFFEHSEHLKQLNTLLNVNGLLLYNRLAYNKEHLAKTNLVIKEMQTSFDQCKTLSIKGNKMLVGYKKKPLVEAF